MKSNKMSLVEKVGATLVFLMVALQAFYAIYAFVNPPAFALLRGTDLLAVGDSAWVQIYASRTLFIALIIACLLILKNYRVLMYAALFGVVMPLTDGILAYMSEAPSQVVIKHLITVLYLMITALVLRQVVSSQNIS